MTAAVAPGLDTGDAPLEDAARTALQRAAAEYRRGVDAGARSLGVSTEIERPRAQSAAMGTSSVVR